MVAKANDERKSNNDLVFVPFVVDSLGMMGVEASKFIDTVAKIAEDGGHGEFDVIKREFVSRLGNVLLRANAKIMNRWMVAQSAKASVQRMMQGMEIEIEAAREELEERKEDHVRHKARQAQRAIDRKNAQSA